MPRVRVVHVVRCTLGTTFQRCVGAQPATLIEPPIYINYILVLPETPVAVSPFDQAEALRVTAGEPLISSPAPTHVALQTNGRRCR